MTARIAYDNGRYTINPPYDIGPRLMPSLKLQDGSRVSITATGRDDEGRVTYRWAVDGASGTGELGAAEDLSSGVGAGVDVEDMFATFSDFLRAWLEEEEGTEGADWFPASMREWADANHEELWFLTNDDPED